MNNFSGTICYLIGGAPRTGKTTLSHKLAREHMTKPFSTDALAGIIMDTAGKDRYPALFYAREHPDAESFYRQYALPEQAVRVSLTAGKELEEPMIIILRRLLPDWGTIVLEGVAITPSFARHLQEVFPDTEFRISFMYDRTGKRIEEGVYSKGLWRRDEPYSDEIKPKEIAYAREFNEWIKNEAIRYGMEIVSIN